MTKRDLLDGGRIEMMTDKQLQAMCDQEFQHGLIVGIGIGVVTVFVFMGLLAMVGIVGFVK